MLKNRHPRVGMVGGGQLARMSHQAAIGLGVELVVLAAGPLDAIVGVSPNIRIGAPDDLDAIRKLARGCDVLTFDHEGVPGECIETLENEGFVVRPGSAASRVAQDKLHARELLEDLGFPVPEFEAVDSASEVYAWGERWGWPVVLKTRTGGYDGRGVVMVSADQLAELVIEPGRWLAERRVSIERELSQIVVRSAGEEQVSYPLVETVQLDGVCVETRTPAPVNSELAGRCATLASEIAEAIDVTGVVAVELFLTTAGQIVVNELALRPHNSGHFSIEGCETSQFENHLRAVLGWPLGSTALRAPAVVMRNILGVDGSEPALRLAAALAVEGAHPHLYGKHPRQGRKLGHVTALGASVDQAAARVSRCAALLGTNEIPA